MPEKKNTPETKPSYLKEMGLFYFTPRLRSVATLFYLIVFGYFAFYYVNNLLLALRFLWYVISSGTALEDTLYLFTSMAFLLSLILPFSISLYSIFALYEIWKRPKWSGFIKWTVTAIIILGSLFIILISDQIVHSTANTSSMQSFIEDTNLRGKL